MASTRRSPQPPSAPAVSRTCGWRKPWSQISTWSRSPSTSSASSMSPSPWTSAFVTSSETSSPAASRHSRGKPRACASTMRRARPGAVRSRGSSTFRRSLNRTLDRRQPALEAGAPQEPHDGLRAARDVKAPVAALAVLRRLEQHAQTAGVDELELVEVEEHRLAIVAELAEPGREPVGVGEVQLTVQGQHRGAVPARLLDRE